MLLRLLLALSAFRFRLAGAVRRELAFEGFRVRYWEVGPADGPPWVLLHGIGATAFSWSPLLGPLARTQRMIVPELSALGGTVGPRPALTVADGARLTSAFVERVAGPVTVAGLSLGGWMAVRAALAHPEGVGRLVLVEPGGYRHQDWGRIQELVTVRELADVDRLLAALFHRVPVSFRLSRAAFRAVFASPPVASLLDELGSHDLYGDDELRALAVPVALVWADHDGVFLPTVGPRMARAIPWSRLYRVPACGHALHWERPRAFRRAVVRAAREVPVR